MAVTLSLPHYTHDHIYGNSQDHRVLFLSSLLQERLEMARMAEEVARQTAEMAIRQMVSEGQSIKLSLGSQELLEEPEVE